MVPFDRSQMDQIDIVMTREIEHRAVIRATPGKANTNGVRGPNPGAE